MIILNLAIGEGDAQKIEFEDKKELIEYLEELKAFDCIWLATSDGENGEILITESIYFLCECIKIGYFNLFSLFPQNFFVQEYQSFESAYSVALSMREGHPKCYD